MNVPPGSAEELDDPRDPFAVAVGERIQKRRVQLGMSQTELASKLTTGTGSELKQTQLSRWERGMNLPESHQWLSLASELQLDIGQLFAGSPAAAPDWAIDLGNRLEAVEAAITELAQMTGFGEPLKAALRANYLQPPKAPGETPQSRVAQAARKSAAESRQARQQKSASPRPRGRPRRDG